MRRRLIFLVFVAISIASAPAFAQGRYVRPYSTNGAMPLERILPQIRGQHPGALSDADGPFADPDGRLHYRLKWLTPEGRVIWLDTDARTGQVLGINHGWGGYGPYPRGYMIRPGGVPPMPPPRAGWERGGRVIPGGRFGGGRFGGGFHGGGHGGPHH